MPPSTTTKGATMVRSHRKPRPTSAATSLRSRIAESYVDMALGGIFTKSFPHPQVDNDHTKTATSSHVGIQGVDPFHVYEVAHVLQRVGRGHADRVHLGCLMDELGDSGDRHLPLSSRDTSASSPVSPLFPVSLRSYSKSPRSGVLLRSLASEVATRTWSDASTNTPISWRPTFHHRNQLDNVSVGAEPQTPTTKGGVDATSVTIATSPIKLSTPGPSRPQSSSTRPTKSGGKSRTLPHCTTSKITTLGPLRLPDKMLDSPFRSTPFRVNTSNSRHSSHYTNSPATSPSGKEGKRTTLAPPTRSATKKPPKKESCTKTM